MTSRFKISQLGETVDHKITKHCHTENSGSNKVFDDKKVAKYEKHRPFILLMPLSF